MIVVVIDLFLKKLQLSLCLTTFFSEILCFPAFPTTQDTLFDPGKSPHFSKDASEEMTS